MDIKTVISTLNDPAKMRRVNLTLTAAALTLGVRRYARERTVWNLLPLVRIGIAAVEVFKPGKDETE
jgi:hypothetical protein